MRRKRAAFKIDRNNYDSDNEEDRLGREVVRISTNFNKQFILDNNSLHQIELDLDRYRTKKQGVIGDDLTRLKDL